MPVDKQLIIYVILSQDSSMGSGYASTTAEQGSTSTQTPLNVYYPREEGKHHHSEKKEDRMKHDLLGIGSQFESKK